MEVRKVFRVEYEAGDKILPHPPGWLEVQLYVLPATNLLLSITQVVRRAKRPHRRHNRAPDYDDKY